MMAPMMAQQDGEGDAVHVAVTNWLRKQLGNKAQARQAHGDAHDAGDDCHDSSDGYCTLRLTP